MGGVVVQSLNAAFQGIFFIVENIQILLAVSHVAYSIHMVVVIREQNMRLIFDKLHSHVMFHAVSCFRILLPPLCLVRLIAVIPLCETFVVDILAGSDIYFSIKVIYRNRIILHAVAINMLTVAVGKALREFTVSIRTGILVVYRRCTLYADTHVIRSDLMSYVSGSVYLLIVAALNIVLLSLRHSRDVPQMYTALRILLRKLFIGYLTVICKYVVSLMA